MFFNVNAANEIFFNPIRIAKWNGGTYIRRVGDNKQMF